ncbi:alpha/beta hydrolase [Halorarum halophilum]|uniref:Alpha/beta hydrolase n=1 Tax=Halorarum halophilum TaxID=2743090 RepID=A0A7D5KTY2_9EURY|nr:alpha/beta hydrolase [Halobaculum halophilum]QLG26680.1 alpha/beta hydrolase [Halobaculum halophilum]
MDRANEPDSEVRSLLSTLDSMDVPALSDLPPEQARELFDELRSAPTDVPDLADVRDETIPGPGGDLPVRVYRPEGEGPFPTLVYVHGGGWVIGSLDSYDGVCRVLAAEAECVVVSVDYRLAPENPFPAAVEDVRAATEWVAGDPTAVDGDGTVAVGGDSAGGNLAAVASLLARDFDGPDLAHQTLIYPITALPGEFPSYEQNATGYYLERADMDYFVDHYFRSDLEAYNPYAMPLEAADHSDLPPATVLTCGFDPLRDEGMAYADALEDDGVAVERLHYPGLIHGAAGMLGEPGLDAARDLLEDVAADLQGSF